VQEDFEPISDFYSQNLKDLIKKMLIKNDIDRPNISEILRDEYVIGFMEKYLHSKIRLVNNQDKGIAMTSKDEWCHENCLTSLSTNQGEERESCKNIFSKCQNPKRKIKFRIINKACTNHFKERKNSMMKLNNKVIRFQRKM